MQESKDVNLDFITQIYLSDRQYATANIDYIISLCSGILFRATASESEIYKWCQKISSFLVSKSETDKLVGLKLSKITLVNTAHAINNTICTQWNGIFLGSLTSQVYCYCS